MVRTQILSAAGDALIAIALAGSLFFNIDPSDARWKVALYLLLTMAPFGLVGPLIGPLIDRMSGGRRVMLMVTSVGRGLLALMMINDLDSLLLFPEAFGVLVLSKTHHVAKSAVVPALVAHDRQLVEANSKLVMVSGIGGALAIGPGLLLALLSSKWVLGLAAVAFAAAALPARRIPRRRTDSGAPAVGKKTDLRTAAIVLAASAMGVLRAIAGFMLFLVAFWLRGEDASAWWFGVVLAGIGVGALLGAALAPPLRSMVSEEVLLVAMLSVTALAAAVAAVTGGDRVVVTVFALVVGFGGAAGKVAFDAIVQREAPVADHGRAFARFESRFQLSWVAGAVLPVVLPSGVLPLRGGMIMLFVAATTSGFLYSAGLWAVNRGKRPPGEVVAARARRAARGTLRRMRERLAERKSRKAK